MTAGTKFERLIVLAWLIFALPSPVWAQASKSTAQPFSETIEGIAVTKADLTQLLGALHRALQPNDTTIPIVLNVKRSAEMPPYDPYAHYAGVEEKAGTKVMNIWINGDVKVGEHNDAMAAAFVLAITDGGYAGSTFKRIYDLCAAKDAQLPAGSPDPFLNRHKFAVDFVHELLTE